MPTTTTVSGNAGGKPGALTKGVPAPPVTDFKNQKHLLNDENDADDFLYFPLPGNYPVKVITR